jgi:hypothetical protein
MATFCHEVLSTSRGDPDGVDVAELRQATGVVY